MTSFSVVVCLLSPEVAQYILGSVKLLCGSKALEKSIALGDEEFVHSRGRGEFGAPLHTV